MSLSKRKIIILFAGLFLLIIAALSIYLVYNKPHLNIERSKVDYHIEAAELLEDFEISTPVANQKYIDKVIVVNGKVSSIEITENVANILLSEKGEFFGVYCSFPLEKAEKLQLLSLGEVVKIKGVCTGYTDDVLLNNCTLN